MTSKISSPKPFKTYKELVEILNHRGMTIEDFDRAERKLAQVGYYRLSGFWYPCREKIPVSNKHERLDRFSQGTSFNKVFELYLFDKKLRLLMLDAIERIEIHIRSVIAHEMGYHCPLAYKEPKFVNYKQTQSFTDKRGQERNIWQEWSQGMERKIKRSQEDCIRWHRANQKQMPFWVVVEAWDFGTMSKYYEILKQKYQKRICERLSIDHLKTLKNWLHEINTLRNRCAHHTRIWNQQSNNPLPILNNSYFQQFNLDDNARTRLFGLIIILWFLIKQIGPSSDWIIRVSKLLNSKPELPGCDFSAIGLNNYDRFPIDKFSL